MGIAYVTPDYATAYFADRPDAEAFLALDAPDKFLAFAGQLIADYCVFYDEAGAYTFAADNAPDFIKRATCEEALYLATLGKDPTAALQVLTLGIVKTDDGTTFDHRFKPDILGVNVRRILTANGGDVAPEASGYADAASGISQGAVTK